MKKFRYIFAASALALCLGACSDDDDNYGVLDGLNMVNRSQSIEEGASIRLNGEHDIVLGYNNLVAIVDGKKATLNGEEVESTADGMNLIVHVNVRPFTEYTLTIPAGMVAIKDYPSTTAPEKTITFNTNKGINPALVDENLVNPAATDAAKKVYSFLREMYGSKTLSGTMASEAINTDYVDFVSQNTGKTPAVVGFDFIHLAYSPAGWVDYGKIDNIKAVWDNGGIPAFTWHWNVPNSSTTAIDDYDCKLDKCTFDITRALTPDTWENRVINADIDKVAGYLKLYQDAGIPIIWRPLHEAAGDYTWGPWFWWGKAGVEKTKELWIYLYNKLVKEHGINNLIWVWTAQLADEGALASNDLVRAAYPGDEYVDIVGVDLYPEAVGQDCNDKFDAAKDMVEGKKLVALSEIGLFPDFDKAADESALWSFFMQWYDSKPNSGSFIPGVFNYNTVETWTSVMNAPYVLNSGDLNLK